jgi:phosphoglycerate dehydrogenase-like enzyme
MRRVVLVVISDPKAGYLKVLERLPEGVEIFVSDDLEELKAAAPRADVLLNGAFHPGLFGKVFPLLSKVQWIHNMSAGVEKALTPEVIASSVPMTNGRGVFKSSLAEFVLAAILYFAKDFRRMNRNQVAGKWEQFDTTELKGQTLGVVGYGEIGRESARLAHAIGLNVVAIRRRVELSKDDPILSAVYAPERLHEMLPRCDYLLAAAPHTPETRGLIGEAELNAMKRDAVVINVGRGAVIDEAALIRVLEEKRIKGAALDVFEHEPLAAGHPFYRLENVLLSPHCADHTPGWVELAVNKFVENFQHFWKGEALENVVDKKAGY